MSSTSSLRNYSPIINSSNETLAAIVCAKIIVHRMSTTCANTHIKSIKFSIGVEKIIFLNPESAALDLTRHEDPK